MLIYFNLCIYFYKFKFYYSFKSIFRSVSSFNSLLAHCSTSSYFSSFPPGKAILPESNLSDTKIVLFYGLKIMTATPTIMLFVPLILLFSLYYEYC